MVPGPEAEATRLGLVVGIMEREITARDGTRIVKCGPHYTPVEYPRVLADELGRWLDRIPGWERTTSSTEACAR